ncbi:uncharacterized protein PAC_06612 [Phialocephala subalpina]|uniref:Uncharacterized protein n=1 Tax=Phialocephala subalpina TaxID=576137 RepID=A0A1L7WVH0_9HELO|nr:uncharacterized protein PAC_06612 [Phialocephala subalpina]
MPKLSELTEVPDLSLGSPPSLAGINLYGQNDLVGGRTKAHINEHLEDPTEAKINHQDNTHESTLRHHPANIQEPMLGIGHLRRAHLQPAVHEDAK